MLFRSEGDADVEAFIAKFSTSPKPVEQIAVLTAAAERTSVPALKYKAEQTYLILTYFPNTLISLSLASPIFEI